VKGGEEGGIRRHTVLGLYIWECPMFQKILVMVQSNGSFWKKKNKTMGVLQYLIEASINK
jgi:hypothetical protein